MKEKGGGNATTGEISNDGKTTGGCFTRISENMVNLKLTDMIPEWGSAESNAATRMCVTVPLVRKLFI